MRQDEKNIILSRIILGILLTPSLLSVAIFSLFLKVQINYKFSFDVYMILIFSLVLAASLLWTKVSRRSLTIPTAKENVIAFARGLSRQIFIRSLFITIISFILILTLDSLGVL